MTTALELESGTWLHELIAELRPICRSMTGDGVRATLRRLQREVPLTMREVPTGTPVFDWQVPREWNIRDAFIKDSRGRRVVDFRECCLHVVGYSVPVHCRMNLAELRPHLHSLPDQPDWIPYRTSYYQETWGFCLAHRRLEALAEDEYEVCIDSTLEPGHLTYGELLLPGDSDKEVLFSAHSCHPWLCNDNLTGIALAVALAKELSRMTSRRYSYRFLWAPGTIGAITWLALNEQAARKVSHGMVLSCLGDRGKFIYKRSRRGDAEIDRAVSQALRDGGKDHAVRQFAPHGYDERQYCSPGFNLPVGVLTRTPNGEYPEYHTSADDLNLIDPTSLGESLGALLRTVSILESNRRLRNLFPKGEPQLGRRGLYEATGGLKEVPQLQMAILWALNYSDGDHDLLWIAERSGMSFDSLRAAAELLISRGLLTPADADSNRTSDEHVDS